MHQRVKELLNEIETRSAKYGDKMQAPASDRQITAMKEHSNRRLMYRPPEEYCEILRSHNGLDWNGFSVFATDVARLDGHDDRFIDGFVDANEQFWAVDRNRNFVTFGFSGDARYAASIGDGGFMEIDATSLDAITRFDSFDDMIIHMLCRALD